MFIKFFNSLGEKITDEDELELERYMNKRYTLPIKYAKLLDKHKLLLDYIKHLKQLSKFNPDCIFDCSFGATSEIVKQCYPKAKKINCTPNGYNINENAGCTHIEMLRRMCIIEQKVGFAFDGDGDRVFAVTKSGEVLDGDKILYVLSKFYLSSGQMLVGTIYSNMGLEKSLNDNGINLVRADVGDKNVLAQMKRHNSNLGGEFSGHIIIKQLTNTGDGLITAIALSNIMGTTKKSLDELLDGYSGFYQAKDDVKFEHFKMNKKLMSAIKELENESTRIIVRPSGTEPVVRIMVEDENKENAQKILKILKNCIKNS